MSNEEPKFKRSPKATLIFFVTLLLFAIIWAYRSEISAIWNKKSEYKKGETEVSDSGKINAEISVDNMSGVDSSDLPEYKKSETEVSDSETSNAESSGDNISGVDPSDLQIKYRTGYFTRLDGSPARNLTTKIFITSKVDRAEISNIMVNRGNLGGLGDLNGKTKTLKYGEIHEVWLVDTPTLLSVQLDYNGQSVIYEIE